MERFEHGGNVYLHPNALDFSASLNPLGMPEEARRALVEGVDAFERYPDPVCTGLVHTVAAFEGVDPSWVLPCAGATDALWRTCQVLQPKRALLCAPCYSGYEQALEQVGCSIVWHDLTQDEGFALINRILPRIDEDIDVVFLANPNNPTGLCVNEEVIVSCLTRAHAVGAVVVLDECFVDLTPLRGSNHLLSRNPNLIIVKALTKTFCLAGLRVGHALCSDVGTIERMRDAGQPWAVSVPAQVAGVACLRDTQYVERGREMVARERARLHAGIEMLGLRVVEGQANYILFEGPPNLAERLLARDILVRSCVNFRGLGAGWYRVAVRTPQENDVLMRQMEEVMR
jgi:threonine-phosphate decarboxylase